MKKRWYKKSGLKGLMVCLTIVALVIGCVCGGASILLMSKGIRPLDSRKYVDSERFTENMYETSHTILEALGETEILNESSKEDLVDLTELKEGKSLSNKNTSGLAYKAGDLTEWSKGSWDRSVNVLICRRPDSSDYYMYYNDFADKIISGELKFVWGSDEEKLSQEYTKDILSMLSGEEYAYYDDGYNYSGIRMDDVEYVEDADGNVVYTNIWNYEPSGNNDAALKEEYKPDGADSILDIVNNNKEWNGNLQKAYQYLYAALVKYNNAVDSKDVLDAYAHGNTNYKYLYVDTKTKKVKEEYGEYVALMGNIPCCSILMEGTEQKVYDYALQECLDGGYDGRFILSGDCDLSPLTPDENIVAAVRAAKDAEKILF